MEWEAQLIEWLQTSLSNAADFAKYFDFFGAETGLLILVLVVMLEKESRAEAGAYCFLRESVASDDQVCRPKTQAIYGVSGQGAAVCPVG